MEEKLRCELKKWETAETVFVGGLGTLWHFVYEWSGKNFLLGLIAPVNESVFEHFKLLLVPVFLFTILEYKYLIRLRGCLVWRKWISMAAGIVFIVVFYYCYKGILQRDVAWLDIASFYGATLLNSFLAYWLLQKPCDGEKKMFSGCLSWAVSIILIVLGTLYPPVELLPGLFISP